YVGAWGGIELLRRRGVEVDVISGSVTDSRMGEDYVKEQFGVPAANARREGAALFTLVMGSVSSVLARGDAIRTAYTPSSHLRRLRLRRLGAAPDSALSSERRSGARHSERARRETSRRSAPQSQRSY